VSGRGRKHVRRRLRAALALALTAAFLALHVASVRTASAIEIVLDDVAPDRVERQRAYARGAVPLPDTPDLENVEQRLAAQGLKRGSPVFLRVFKATSELELWMQKDGAFVLFATYPVCHWTGTLGPKLSEGDKQSPEGFYGITYRQTRLVGRWRHAFNLGFPNRLDQINKRTGSYILMHGGCSSTGCYAMTDQVQREIFSLVEAALTHGQKRAEVHIFPFRMTADMMEATKSHPWAAFWADLKAGYDSFERTRLPPRVAICSQRYTITDGALEDISAARPMLVLPGSACVAPSDKDRPDKDTIGEREIGEAERTVTPSPIIAAPAVAASPVATSSIAVPPSPVVSTTTAAPSKPVVAAPARPVPVVAAPVHTLGGAKIHATGRLQQRGQALQPRAAQSIERAPLASERPMLQSLGERPFRDPRITTGGG
jgi:murein L,D-transpeptidase YafK